MTKQRRIHVPVGAILFIAVLIGLAAIFVIDWQVTQTRPIVARELASEKIEPPSPPATKEEAKPAIEAPPAVENEPTVAEREQPPKDDPWAEEKARMKDRQRRRQDGFVQVNPKILFNGEVFAFGGDMNLFNARPIMPEIRPFAAPRMIDPQKFADEFFASATARRVAFEVQTMFFTTIPDSRQFISSFDVGVKDGRLIVNVRDAFMRLAPDSQRSIMEAVAEVWRETKYTKEHKCSKAVEFRSWDGWKETLEP